MSNSESTGTISNHVRLIDWLQERLKTTIITFVFCGVTLFACWFLQYQDILSLSKYLCVPFGLGFILSGSILVVLLGDYCRLRWWRLHHLAADERDVLRVYLENNVTTHPWVVADAKPKSLAMEGILIPAPHTQNVSKGFMFYTIRPWILRYMRKHF
jgi:hypothetical protein